MSLLNETKRLLRYYKIIPKKRLGQNFLIDEDAIYKMIDYASISGEDVILEVGAGFGFITERIARDAGRVIAVEIDGRLVRALRRRLSAYNNIEILHGDVMRIDIPRFNKVISTPPYSISSPLHFWLLNREFKLAILSFQEEFARRLVAPVGSKDYGRLTIATYYRADVEILDVIPKEAFWPKPKVDSLIVRLRPKRPPFKVKNEEIFFDVVRAIFTQRNRKIRNDEMRRIANSLPFSNRRPRELSPEEIGLISDRVVEKLERLNLI